MWIVPSFPLQNCTVTCRIGVNVSALHANLLSFFTISFPGPIKALVAVTADHVVMALGLPSEQLVKQSQADMFEATPLTELHIANVSRHIQTKPPIICNESGVKVAYNHQNHSQTIMRTKQLREKFSSIQD